MRVAVEFMIHRRIAQTEVGTQVNHPQPPLKQCLCNLRRHSMRQGQKCQLRPRRGNPLRIGLGKGQ